jgi:hypothetical protein
MLRKAELVELAEFLDQDVVGTYTVLQLRAILQPAVDQAVAAGITHADFVRILPAPQQEPEGEEDDDEDDDEDETTAFHGVQSEPLMRGPASVSSSASRTHRLSTRNVSATVNLSQR